MLIATDDCLYTSAANNGDLTPELLLEGESIDALAEGRTVSAVCLGGVEVMLLENGSSRRLATGIEGSVESVDMLSEDPVELLVGTEPPHLFRVRCDDALIVEGFDSLECRHEWTTPWGGPPAVRSVIHTGDWVYADIHVGSIMRSPDRGATWEPVTPDLHKDVHQIAVSPAAAQRLYANTANAVYVSDDRGETWQHRSAGLPMRYGRAIAVHPHNADCVLATVSEGPHGDAEGQMYRSADAGLSWAHVAAGFPATTTGNIDTFRVAFSADGTALAAVDDKLYRSADEGVHWEIAWTAPAPIAMISCAAP